MYNILLFIGFLSFISFFILSPLIFKLSLKILKKENIIYWRILGFQFLLLIGLLIIFFVIGSIFNMSGIFGILIILISFFIFLFLLLNIFKLRGILLVLIIYTMFSLVYLIGYYYLLSNNNTYEYVAKINLESNNNDTTNYDIEIGNSINIKGKKGEIMEKSTNYDIEIGNLINIKGEKGELMEIPENKELKLITSKMNNSIINNNYWYYEYIQKYPSGVLPYHKNLGITESEYKKILDLGKTKIKKVSDISLKFIKNNSSYNLKIKGDKFKDLDNLIIDLENFKIKTQYGDLNNFSVINNTNVKSPTGKWKGYQWKGETPSRGGIFIKFAIGKLSNNGKGIIYYDVENKIEPDKSHYYIITYNID